MGNAERTDDVQDRAGWKTVLATLAIFIVAALLGAVISGKVF
jgi:hypothetical protein